MAKYSYEVIIDKLLQTKVGNGIQKPEIVVVHHSNVVIEGEYDVIKRLNELSQNHIRNLGNGGLAYHFYIPRNETNTIYVTRYLNQIQWHCSNSAFNTKSIGVLVEGDFDTQKPTPTQLKKLRQLLDELPTLFGNKDLELLNPKDSTTVRTGAGVEVKGALFVHSEVAEAGYETSCAGVNLTQYVINYRAKNGAVDWSKPLPQSAINKLPEIEPSDTESSLHFVSGNLNSKIKQLEEEKTKLASELDQMRNFIKTLETRISQLDYKIISMQSDNKTLLDQKNALQDEISALRNKYGIKLDDALSDIQYNSWSAKFIRFWDSLPMWVRYSLPNILAAVVPVLIIIIEEVRYEDFNNIATIGVAGFVFGLMKSLIIGVLRSIEDKGK